jgi:hypothetical protein
VVFGLGGPSAVDENVATRAAAVTTDPLDLAMDSLALASPAH